MTDVDETNSTSARDRATTSQVLDDRYVLLDQLGTGGAGAVWRAHDQVLDRTVAVKLLHQDLARDGETAARFRAEGAAAAKLTHPHAVIVYDIGHVDGSDYLVMELVEGGTLGDVLEQGPLPPGVAAAVGAQIGRALGTAHGRGLVHRDVKPANVLVTRDGVAKVADFGIARALGEATTRLTTPGHVVGTARYLAPEQLRDQPVDGRADVYALGLMLHQAVTGALPFGEGTAAEVAARRLVADGLPRPSSLAAGVSSALDEVIVRATAIDPEKRFADGAAFATALSPFAAPQAATELASRIRRIHRDPVHATAPITPPSARPAPSAAPTAPSRPPGPDPWVGEPTMQSLDATPRTGHGPPPAADPDDEDVRRPLLPWAVALLVLVLGMFFVWPGGLGDDDQPDDGPTGEQAEGGDSEAAATIEIQSAGDHDPFGDGDRRENPDEVQFAIDDDPGTAWTTVGYNSADFGGLKDGVGLWLDLGESAPLDRIRVTSSHPGYRVVAYVGGDAPPENGQAPDDWGRGVGAVRGDQETADIIIENGTETGVVLLWFTELGPDGGRFRGSIADVVVNPS
ncbi:MAG: serine/threonine-protein kinase [Egicoccus sp.]